MARKTQQVESRMISEYMLQTYSESRFVLGQPLGKVSEALMRDEGYQKALGVSRPFRPEVDALVFLPNTLLLVEAKVWQVINGLAKLPLYKSLVPFTPELRDYKDYPVEMLLVVAWTNSNLEIMARDAGVKLAVYCPAWLADVVNAQHLYWTADYRRAREDKLKLRDMLGLD
jgi:hypothetical protein